MNIKKDSLELITYFKNCLSLNEYDYLANSNIVLNCLKEDKNISEAYITVNNYLNPTFKEIQETFQKNISENPLKSLTFLSSISNTKYPVLTVNRKNISYTIKSCVKIHAIGCPLCVSNLGLETPNRKFVSLSLSNNDYLLQVPPASYIEGHYVLLNKRHVPILLDLPEIQDMLDFSYKFPNVTICANNGSNRIGGSIPNHAHFQVITSKFNISKAKDLIVLKKKKDYSISIIDWYVPSYRIKSKNKELIAQIYSKIKQLFESEKYEKIVNNKAEHHNCLNIVSYYSNKEYVLEVILRSNLMVNNKYKFDTPEKCLQVKNSAIGIFEVSGLFILDDKIFERIKNINKPSEKYIFENCKKILKGVSIFKKRQKKINVMSQLIKDLDLFCNIWENS